MFISKKKKDKAKKKKKERKKQRKEKKKEKSPVLSGLLPNTFNSSNPKSLQMCCFYRDSHTVNTVYGEDGI